MDLSLSRQSAPALPYTRGHIGGCYRGATLLYLYSPPVFWARNTAFLHQHNDWPNGPGLVALKSENQRYNDATAEPTALESSIRSSPPSVTLYLVHNPSGEKHTLLSQCLVGTQDGSLPQPCRSLHLPSQRVLGFITGPTVDTGRRRPASRNKYRCCRLCNSTTSANCQDNPSRSERPWDLQNNNSTALP